MINHFDNQRDDQHTHNTQRWYEGIGDSLGTHWTDCRTLTAERVKRSEPDDFPKSPNPSLAVWNSMTRTRRVRLIRWIMRRDSDRRIGQVSGVTDAAEVLMRP